MRITLSILLLASLTISGCARIADSRINPLNWFGRAENTANVDAAGQIRPLVPERGITVVVDNRALVTTATALSINRTPEGAIVEARGQTTGQGFHNAELVPVLIEGGVLTLAFRAMPPSTPQPGKQTIVAAHVLNNAELSSIRQVRVQAQSNTLSARR